MDKQEYREIIDGIRQGYARRDYERVIMFAREISPKKIRENRIIEMISDAYEATGKPGLARQTLEVAYERMQNGKQIAYKLAEQSIRLNDIDGAVRYYEDFCRVAPNDSRKYILKYEIATAGGLTIYDRIKILEEYNRNEVDEEALYELARLYHEAGMGDQCAATVDELTVWFSDGEYIKKALELKFAHTPLSPKQQALYENIMSEFMDEEETPSRESAQAQPVEDAFDNEAEEFANRYLNGTLENTKSIDTEAINAAIEEAEKEENSSTKKLSLNETVAFAAMSANMAREAEISKAYAMPEPEPEKTPLEKMMEEPKPLTPEIGGYYARKTAEIDEGSLSLNINMEDDYNIEGQMSIDQMFQTYANNIENNEDNRAAVEQVEAERLRQIREAVESSIVATPFMEIEDEPEEPVEPEETDEPEIQIGYIPKTAAEKIPGDLTIESMLAAMGETVEDEVLTGAPAADEQVEVMAEIRAEEPETAAVTTKEEKTEILFDAEPPKEKFVFTNKVEDNPSIESELNDIMAELPVADIPKEEPKPVIEYKSSPDDVAELELAMDDIMAELPLDDFASGKQSEEDEDLEALGDFFAGAFAREAVLNAADEKTEDTEGVKTKETVKSEIKEEPVFQVKAEPEEDAFGLESAMDDIMAELPLYDFAAENSSEEIPESFDTPENPTAEKQPEEEAEGLDALGDFFAGAFAAETAEPETEIKGQSGQELNAEPIQKAEPEQDKTDSESGLGFDLDIDSIIAELPVEDAQPAGVPPKYTITEEIREDMAEFLLVEGMQEEIETAIANIIYTKKNGKINGGNLIVTGDAKSGKTFLAITVVKAVTQELGEGNGRVAKVQSTSINGKNIDKIFQKIEGNDIIIENVGELDESTLLGILEAMENGTAKNMVVFEGNVLAIETMINNHPAVENLFRNRIDIKELSISQWADVACGYANHRGYNVNDMALLALHAKIDEVNMPTTRFGYEDVTGIIDRAIANAERRSTGKIFSTVKKDASGRYELIESDFDK